VDARQAERLVVVLLRLTAPILLLAAGAAVMPFGWMQAVHAWLGMGDLPDRPIVAYLTRSLSLLYAGYGVLVLYVSLDVRRYLPLIRTLALVSLAGGAVLLAIDLAAELPWFWTAGEGPGVMAASGLLAWLAGRAMPLAEPSERGRDRPA
jgi:hypothetical protein